jgi:hypothetical protein
MAKSTRSPLQKFFADSIKWAKARDKKRGMIFDYNISEDYLIALYTEQGGLCAHTGWIMSFDRGIKDGALCTIDRIDNNKGYTMDNIMLCRWDINKMRGNMPLELFRALCTAFINK